MRPADVNLARSRSGHAPAQGLARTDTNLSRLSTRRERDTRKGTRPCIQINSRERVYHAPCRIRILDDSRPPVLQVTVHVITCDPEFELRIRIGNSFQRILNRITVIPVQREPCGRHPVALHIDNGPRNLCRIRFTRNRVPDIGHATRNVVAVRAGKKRKGSGKGERPYLARLFKTNYQAIHPSASFPTFLLIGNATSIIS